MRVVAGELKGRRLVSPPRRKGNVRPTSDRAREAVFSILGDVSGLRVLDLFCGTGALAIEALSRGAGEAVLVDSQPELARRNVSALGLDGRCRVLRAEVLDYLESAEDRFELVFCDPPYAMTPKLGPRLDSVLPQRLAPGARVVVESAVREPLELALPVLRERAYGEALVRIHTSVSAERGTRSGDANAKREP